MWRSCWGALLLAGLLSLLGAGYGVGAVNSEYLQAKAQKVGPGQQVMLHPPVKQASDARAGFACGTYVSLVALIAREEHIEDFRILFASRPGCRP